MIFPKYILKSILCLFLLFLSIAINAQNISVTDFKLAEQDLTANQQGTIVLDQNGEKCALIKVRTTQTGFNFDAGSLGVRKVLQKTAEIWVYVPYGVRKLTISHQKFGTLEYSIPMAVQKAKTYIMDLKAETPLPVDHQRLTIKCTPSNAAVMIDGDMIDLTDGKAEVTLKLGVHKYQALVNGYYPQEGTVELKASSPGRIILELEPKEGTKAQKTATPSQMEVKANFFEENPNGITCTVNGITFEMVKVEGGTFMMGALDNDKDAGSEEKPAHQVTIKTYYIGKYEVTQELWQAMMDSNPSYFKGEKLPVEWVNWDACQDFLSKLYKLTGKKFRLPTEAEWEFASRGGNKSHGYRYSGSNTLEDVAWFKKNSEGKLHEVGAKAPNELGIYDMSGNVQEWCHDWYDKNYYKVSQSYNPTGAKDGTRRVVRGGDIYDKSEKCRSTNRRIISPLISIHGRGIRLALSE